MIYPITLIPTAMGGPTMLNPEREDPRLNLRDLLLSGRRMNFRERTKLFSDWIQAQYERRECLFLRQMDSQMGREITILDHQTGGPHRMLMFGSNNYLGLTTHPYVMERMKKAVDQYGVGMSGSPSLNGYSSLHRELEERVSALKGTEETLIFPTGYGANTGVLGCLPGRRDTVLYDILSHASTLDGLKTCAAPSAPFHHNDIDELAGLLQGVSDKKEGQAFVCVEGVYSMDGDLAPLDRIVPLCRQHDALLVMDDAHGLGVTGPGGSGTGHYFDVADQVDITVGTFSKTLAMNGGFVSTTKPIADYLRFFGRSYMFSTSLTPVVVAGILAGLDVMEREPWLHAQLMDNLDYTARGLRRIGFDINPKAAVIPLRIAPGMNLRQTASWFHDRGIFLNSVEYPAVAVDQQRLRISLMATHTREDLDYLLASIEEAWAPFRIRESRAA
jgi:glycine C-acetyltransferase